MQAQSGAVTADQRDSPYSLGRSEVGRVIQRRQGISALEIEKMFSNALEIFP